MIPLRLGAALLTVLLLALPAYARAASTFGADLSQAVSGAGTCGVPAGNDCSLLTKTRSTGAAETGSPIDGVLVSVRIRHRGTATVSVSLRTLRPTGRAGEFLNVGPEIAATVPAAASDTTTEFATRKTISAGDLLDVGYVMPADSFVLMAIGSPRNCWYRQGAGTQHVVGTTATYFDTACAYEPLLSGTVEPDADRDGYGDESQDQCPTNASVQAACPSSTPTPSDTRAPVLTLGGASRQHVVKHRAVIVAASADEAVTLVATGSLNVPGASKALKLRRASANVASGKKTKLKLKLTRKVLRAARRALRHGRKVKASVTVSATDSAGNVATAKRTVRARKTRGNPRPRRQRLRLQS